MSKIKITDDDILVIIDPQYDFVEGGALAVPGGSAALVVAEALAAKFNRVVISQDWHPAAHGSFASQHGVAPFTLVQLGGQDQVAWPDHCVQGTKGAELIVAPLNTSVVVRKGMNPGLDSYSAFIENDHKTETGLGGYIKALPKVRNIFFVGLARNYCVGFSALDAAKLGLVQDSAVLGEGGALYLVEDGVASIPDGSDEAMTEKLLAAGVKLITTADIA